MLNICVFSYISQFDSVFAISATERKGARFPPHFSIFDQQKIGEIAKRILLWSKT